MKTGTISLHSKFNPLANNGFSIEFFIKIILFFVVDLLYMIGKSKISDIVLRIASNYNPEKIILFGSYAKGNYSDDSDLDFILIKETNTPKHKRAIEVRRLFYGLPIPMDFKIYTSTEFNKELTNKYSFLSSAMQESKILYERKD